MPIRLLSLIMFLLFSLSLSAQPPADRQYQSYQRQHEQTVRAYSVPDKPVPPRTSPTPSATKYASPNSSSSSSSGSRSTPAPAGRTGSTRNDDDDDDYKPFTKAESAAYEIESAERKSRPAKYDRLVAEAGLQKTAGNFARLYKLALQAGYTEYEAVGVAKGNTENDESGSSSGTGAPRFANPASTVKLYNGKTMECSEVTLDNGDKFQGEWTNGKPSNGRMQYADGSVFLGEIYSNGKRINGLTTFANGDSFDGRWNGTGFQKGKFVFSDGSFDGEFRNNQLYRGVLERKTYKRRGEFYESTDLKAGRDVNSVATSYGFFDSTSGAGRYRYSNNNRSGITSEDLWAGGKPVAYHSFTKDGDEIIQWKVADDKYRWKGIVKKGGAVSLIGVTPQNTKENLPENFRKELLLQADKTLATIAAERESFRQAINWDTELLREFDLANRIAKR